MARTTRKFTDIDAAFLPHPVTGDLFIKVDDRAIKFAVKSLVLTSNYERLFHSEIGTPVKRLLFDNMDDMFIISMTESITQVITNYEPRVDVLAVDVEPRPDNNSVYISITFRIKNTETPLNVGVTLERTR
jgi:phage baseplate assembly protein W